MMNGPKRARHWLDDYLSADIPTRLIPYRTWWGLDETTLPTPTLFLPYEPIAIDNWPMIYSIVLSTNSVTRDDWTIDDDPQYMMRLDMRTYIWAKGDSADLAMDIRDDLTTVVRDALLDGPAVSTYNKTQLDCSAVIDEGSMREEFSDLTLLKGERVLAGAYVGYELEMTEVVTRAPLGSGIVDEIPTVILGLIEKTANAPTLVLAVDGGTGEAVLTWKRPTWDGGGYEIASYRVEQSEDDGDTWQVSIADTGVPTPTATVTGLTPSTVYLFRVGGINEFGLGAMSTQAAPFTAP